MDSDKQQIIHQERTMTEEKTLRQRIRDGEVLVALRGSLNTTGPTKFPTQSDIRQKILRSKF